MGQVKLIKINKIKGSWTSAQNKLVVIVQKYRKTINTFQKNYYQTSLKFGQKIA